MSIEFTRDELDGLSTTDDESPDSRQFAEEFGQLRTELKDMFSADESLERFYWSGSPGSPYVGPPDPDASQYLWVGVAHEGYQSLGKPSSGLQFEFGFDVGSARGFFQREVICGLYLGPWADDTVVADIVENLRRHGSEVSEFLSTHPEFVLATKHEAMSGIDVDELAERANELTDGFVVTLDLTLADICGRDIRELVFETFDETLSLYYTLAGERATGDHPGDLFASDGHSEEIATDTANSVTDSDPYEGKAPEPTVEAIAAYSSILTEDDVEKSVGILGERGASSDEALEHIRRYGIDMERDEGLYAISGLGPTAGYALAEAGITTTEELSASSHSELKATTGLRSGQIRRILSDVRKSKHTQGDSNSTSSETRDGSVEKEEPDPGHNDSKATDTVSNQQGTSESQDYADITPNPLSEYYEAIRSVREVVATVMQVAGTDIHPDDLTDPCVQYHVLLDACLSHGTPDVTFAGFGPQHQDRLPFPIYKYRDAFGDGNWVTEYQVIDTEPYHRETQEWLAKHTWLEDTYRFARPVPPGGSHPLPEIVTSVEELQYAMEILNNFPIYPDLPTEVGASDETMPIADLYRELFSTVPGGQLVELDELSGPGQATGDPITGPVVDATPTSESDVQSFLLDYGKLTHLFRRIDPPALSPVDQSLPVFGLEWYRRASGSFTELQDIAKYGRDEAIPSFRRRLQDMIHRRFLRDHWNYDYITVFPGHEAGSLSPQLVELARDAVVETSIVYTPILERIETASRQREKSADERQDVAVDPEDSLRARTKLDGETVLLFDDICTTGSSLLAGTHLLQEAGAGRVIGLTLGFTPGVEEGAVMDIEKPDAYASEIIAGIER